MANIHEKVICFGDSNTYGYDPRSCFGGQYPASARWPEVLASLTGYQVVNAGENGREVPRYPSELDRFLLMLNNQQPVDLLLILLGTNDILQGNSADVVRDRMKQFLSRIPLQPDQIVLIAPPVLQPGAWVETSSFIDTSIRLSKHYQELADHMGIRFADTSSWEIPMTFDGVHFTEDGHRIFADQLSHHL